MGFKKYLIDLLIVSIFTVVAVALNYLVKIQYFVMPNIEYPFYHLPVIYVAYRLSYKYAIWVALFKSVIFWYLGGATFDWTALIIIAEFVSTAFILAAIIPIPGMSMFSSGPIMGLVSVTAQTIMVAVLTKSPEIFVGYYPLIALHGITISFVIVYGIKVFDEKIIKRKVNWSTPGLEMSDFDEN